MNIVFIVGKTFTENSTTVRIFVAKFILGKDMSRENIKHVSAQIYFQYEFKNIKFINEFVGVYTKHFNVINNLFYASSNHPAFSRMSLKSNSIRHLMHVI